MLSHCCQRKVVYILQTAFEYLFSNLGEIWIELQSILIFENELVISVGKMAVIVSQP